MLLFTCYMLMSLKNDVLNNLCRRSVSVLPSSLEVNTGIVWIYVLLNNANSHYRIYQSSGYRSVIHVAR